jgi:hypothetical protein
MNTTAKAAREGARRTSTAAARTARSIAAAATPKRPRAKRAGRKK